MITQPGALPPQAIAQGNLPDDSAENTRSRMARGASRS